MICMSNQSWKGLEWKLTVLFIICNPLQGFIRNNDM